MQIKLRTEPQLGNRPYPCRSTRIFLPPRRKTSSVSHIAIHSLSDQISPSKTFCFIILPSLPISITAKIHPLTTTLSRRPASLALQIHQLITNRPYSSRTMAPRGGKRGGGRGGGGGREQSREVQISKALSLVLRHAAEKEGVKIDSQGYANVGELVCLLSRDD